jgi:hypothetical protein
MILDNPSSYTPCSRLRPSKRPSNCVRERGSIKTRSTTSTSSIPHPPLAIYIIKVRKLSVLRVANLQSAIPPRVIRPWSRSRLQHRTACAIRLRTETDHSKCSTSPFGADCSSPLQVGLRSSEPTQPFRQSSRPRQPLCRRCAPPRVQRRFDQ